MSMTWGWAESSDFEVLVGGLAGGVQLPVLGRVLVATS